MKAAPKGRREPGGGGPHPRQVEPMISMQILPTKRRFQRSNGGSTVHYPGRLHRGHSGPLGNYITEMMETAATQGREIKAVDRWMVSGKSLIIREMALVPLQLLEKEMAAALLVGRNSFCYWSRRSPLRCGKAREDFFFFQHGSTFPSYREVQRGRRSVVSPPPLAGPPSIRRSQAAWRLAVACASGGCGEPLFCSTSAVS